MYLQNCAAPGIFLQNELRHQQQVVAMFFLLWATAVCCCGSAAGPFAVGVRELLGHYMVLEEQFMEDTTDMAMRIDEVVSVLSSVGVRGGLQQTAQ